jgi:hypothetical protein
LLLFFRHIALHVLEWMESNPGQLYPYRLDDYFSWAPGISRYFGRQTETHFSPFYSADVWGSALGALLSSFNSYFSSFPTPARLAIHFFY